ncbi:DUF2905 domain-containing protein [Candidatus Neptunochlamydia vexilliferae]|uniref:DUF2905 domain-containing protein n=1 Tax=Candidatus Neptunichlamydia vexilliferae TaxID=1651774 RepID=A0ABS0AZE4_9BACT|nr:hypothetical protein [Candidatus Neptunochlamydia vexilliferae]
MGRLIGLTVLCIIIIGALLTFDIPLNWIGHLPGDFSIDWNETKVIIPVTTSVIFSLVLSAILFLFAK